ncbi:MAG: hypothetical protein GEU80_10065 [Dehalococcoidia bacterium]|nr:hypothetical protein [Dehalococcoidia bacterium]
MPQRRIPRAFTLPWGSGQIVEEAAIEGGLHAPALQLLHYELGEKKGQQAIRFAAYAVEGEMEDRALIVNEREFEALRREVERSPRLKALLRRLVE